jgi:hypothetical protein
MRKLAERLTCTALKEVLGENGIRKHFFTTSGEVIGFGPREVLGLRREYAMMI